MSLASLEHHVVERFWREAISRARAADALRTIRPELTTKYATIWQRDAGGWWRLAVDSSSPNP
jgi:ketosteroid isomerase-like protein